MLKVCFPFVGDSIGGSHKSTMLLIEGLDRSIFSPLVVLHTEGPLATFLKEKAIAYELLPLSTMAGSEPSLLNFFLAQLRNYKILLKFIRKWQIDIVHTNDLRCNLSWGLVSRIHAQHVWHQRTVMSSAFLWRMIGLLTNYVICISDTVLNTYRSFASVRVLTNPFRIHNQDRSVAKHALITELNLDPSQLLVGIVGRLVPRKGLDIIGPLTVYLPPEVSSVVIGDGPLRDTLPVTVHKLGFRDPIEPVIAGLDVLITLSLEEGFGRVVVEGMLAGTPVVASDIPAHREITGNGQHAVLVSPQDPKAVANAIRELLTDKEKNSTYVKTSFEFARHSYSQAAHVKGVEEIYKNLKGAHL